VELLSFVVGLLCEAVELRHMMPCLPTLGQGLKCGVQGIEEDACDSVRLVGVLALCVP
jgi:hypothetical protein